MDNDSIIRSFEAADWYKEQNSHCNKWHVAAMLNFNGRDYIGVNGNRYHSCKEKGPDFCMRDKSYGGEYVTCPSSCAETAAILAALFDGVDPTEWSAKEKRTFLEDKIESKALGGATLITTGAPCERCTSVIIDTGISEVYLGQFKKGEQRLKDGLKIAYMGDAGVGLHQISKYADECGIHYEVNDIQPDPAFKFFVRMGARVSAIDYLMDLLDPCQRELKKEICSNMREKEKLGLFDKHRFSVEHLY